MPLDFSEHSPDWDILLSSIWQSEGGNKTRYPYGIKSVKAKDENEARQIALNTVKNNYARWNAAGQPGNYIDFLASRYVPVKSDPRGNINWRMNVPKIYAQLEAKKKPREPVVQPAFPDQRSILLEPMTPVTFPTFPHYPLLAR